MASTLKGFFSPALVRRLAGDIARVHPGFPERWFVQQACAGLAALELLDRGKHIARALAAHLPPAYPEAVEVLLRSLGPEHATDELLGAGMAPFFYLPHTLFVAERGLDHFDLSMRAQYELTKRFSAESSIRPYIARDPERTFAVLREWTSDANPHVRRLVSEGTRLRLPWARARPLARRESRARARAAGAAEGRPVDARAPQRGQQPQRPRQGAARPAGAHVRRLARDGASPERRALVEHALRSAVKRGDAGGAAAARLRGEGGGLGGEACASSPRACRSAGAWR